MLLWALGALVVAAVSKGTPRLFHLEKGRCYVWTYRYSPRLTEAEWAQVVAFHRQFFDSTATHKLNLLIDRARQTIRFDYVQTETRDVPQETRDKPATHVQHVRADIRWSSRVNDCRVPEV